MPRPSPSLSRKSPAKADLALRALVTAIAKGDTGAATRLLTAAPELAKASFHTGATRQAVQAYFLDEIGRYVVAGDTALHIAAASYQTELVRALLDAEADVHARNRLGSQPLHAAAVGVPGSRTWNPSSQTATLRCLIQAGADPNATDKRGVSSLHRAVRTRCAQAVQTLLECGSDPTRANKSGSTPLLLAMKTTGRGGSGSPEAKAQQKEILLILQRSLASRFSSKR
jgi:hypothetical protein